jgi:hypothetical protein
MTTLLSPLCLHLPPFGRLSSPQNYGIPNTVSHTDILVKLCSHLPTKCFNRADDMHKLEEPFLRSVSSSGPPIHERNSSRYLSSFDSFDNSSPRPVSAESETESLVNIVRPHMLPCSQASFKLSYSSILGRLPKL